MNWYLNNAGAAEGPYDDSVMTEMAQAQKIDSDSLVWHAGLEAWAFVAAISPSWWGAALPSHPLENARAGKSKKNTIVAKAPSKAELVVLASTPHDGSSAPVPKRRLAAPLAPSEDAAAEPKSGGLLKKLFGFGKTKK